MEKTVLGLFPTPLYVAEIGLVDSQSLEFVRSLEMAKNISGNTYSLDTKVLDKLPWLSEKINQHLNDYINTVLCPRTKFSLRVTQSWINRNEYEQAHHRHSHPNSIISGVYYFYPQNPPPIIFYRKKESDLLIETDLHNQFNSKEFKLNIKQGMIVLFPSYMEHSVEENTTDNERISLAFNTFFNGIIGDDYALTELEVV